MPEDGVDDGGGRSAAEERREEKRGIGRWKLAGQRKKREGGQPHESETRRRRQENQGDARRRRHSGVNNVEEMSLIVKYGTEINLCSATSAEGLNRVDDLAPLR